MKPDGNLSKWLSAMNIDSNVVTAIVIFSQVLILIAIAIITDYITKKIILRILHKVIRKSKSNWDDMLYERKVFAKLSHIIPAIIVQFVALRFLAEYEIMLTAKKYLSYVNLIHNATSVFIIFISIRAITSFINGLHDIYLSTPVSKDRPIKSYLQIVILIIYFVGIILIFSIILNKEVAYFFTGLGAIAAVLMLVFKDTILGLVGGIQLSANDMVKLGDWIEMPGRKADGDVIDISLHTVKVQNWDKTITTIPTYALVNESFVNWRGMEQSGGRRIKRSINIDMTSVKFCDDEMIERLKKIEILRPYIDSKLAELNAYNDKHSIDETVKVNGRRMTNIGTFRRYVELYLHNHPKINNNMTFLIRQLQPGEFGIPLEIYVFSSDKVWANYEAIQSDIFDHIMAAIPEFDLAVFQSPTGNDFKKMIAKNSNLNGSSKMY